MLSLLFSSLLSVAVAPPPPAVPDQIVMKDGRKLTGRILCETNDVFCIRSGRGEVEVPRKNVAEVRSIEYSLADFIRRWDAMPRTDPRALSELAAFCDTRGLFGEAFNLRLRILLLEPGNDAAARAVGAIGGDGGWVMDLGQRQMRMADFLGAKSRWRDAVALRTAHFLVRTDLPLEKLLDATVQLERHYLRFYGMLGPELGLYTFNEVPEVNVYGDVRAYPMPPLMGEGSWFQYGINQLNVLAQDPLDLRVIQRDITEMLLYNALRQSSGHNGELMPWAWRGLAEYFAATAGKHVGDPWAPLGTPSHLLFDVVARDPNPLPLYRLLNTARSEFRSGPDGERRSMYAYTFMHYLLNGAGGELRSNFFAYVRAAWLGAGGTGLLYQTLGVRAGDLQQGWMQHVQDVASGR